MPSDLSRRSVIAGGAAVSLLGTHAARAASRGGFASDADLLEHAYTALHPGLYRYNSPAATAGHFAVLRRALTAARSEREAYLALAAATAAVRCGHSYPNFFNQSKAVGATLFDLRDRLPLHFRWIGERMIVTRDLSPGAALPVGSEIVSIEGVPSRAILNTLVPLARADGHNDGKRRALLGVDGNEALETFDVYLPMALPTVVARGMVRIVAVDPTGQPIAGDVRLLTAVERRASTPSIVVPKNAPLWRIEHRPDGVTVLTMPTWSVYNGTWDWAAWLNAALDNLAGDATRSLLIDLRGNEGGLDCGDVILARLIDRDLDPNSDRQRVRYRAVPADLAPHVDTWDDGFRNWAAAAVGPRPDGFYDLVRRRDAGRPVIRPAERKFMGRLIVLTDAMNSSATFGFARLVKDHRLGTLVGETTGGNRRGINGGAFLFLRLPATGLEVDIPLIGTFPATPQPDAGIVPDVVVQQTSSDIVAGFDRVMATGSVSMRPGTKSAQRT